MTWAFAPPKPNEFRPAVASPSPGHGVSSVTTREALGRKVDRRVSCEVVERCRDQPMVDRKSGLDDSGHPRGSLQMPDVRLYRANEAWLVNASNVAHHRTEPVASMGSPTAVPGP